MDEMKSWFFGFEYLDYFWAILLSFIMERICCLQEQFTRDYIVLPDPPTNDDDSYHSINLEEFSDRDGSLKLSFLRLCRMSQVTILLTLVYFFNICFWFVMTKKASPTYRFKISISM
ncbi:uncharacterized protein LOC133519518 [Cydia pomonella]|uniref:uncharacterized protein LOC133519518 n=1 Tax=Cydia pomonella TaxID=82600 RepID=UPI002ADE7B8E|nr:uncharacterized protein LOC133519518 [Cydia pomonella]